MGGILIITRHGSLAICNTCVRTYVSLNFFEFNIHTADTNAIIFSEAGKANLKTYRKIKQTNQILRREKQKKNEEQTYKWIIFTFSPIQVLCRSAADAESCLLH